MILVAALLGMAPLWLLIGILMLITGVVKIVMLQIWTRIARLGTDEHDPINAL
jgi:predicted signal transduction protein with EAL and GGDEF domain